MGSDGEQLPVSLPRSRRPDGNRAHSLASWSPTAQPKSIDEDAAACAGSPGAPPPAEGCPGAGNSVSGRRKGILRPTGSQEGKEAVWGQNGMIWEIY